MKSMQELLDIMKALRDPDTGCPWDKEQTMTSIIPHSLEEVYELVDAIERNSAEEIKDELGDLLFHIVFYSQMASEAGYFDFEDVVAAVCEKLKRRHPHVFADRQINTSEELRSAWEEIKRAERMTKNRQDHSHLDNIGEALPAMLRAVKLQKRAAMVGFDWDEPAPVMGKIEEEVNEIKQAMDESHHRHYHSRLQGELGDLFFAVINLARHLDINPEVALRETNRKFQRRFRFIEEALKSQGRDMTSATLDEMEELWEQAKKKTC